MRWLLLVLGVLGALVLIASMERTPPSPEVKAKDDARAAIRLCWTDYERKSLDPAQKRFIAGTCEMMEQRFRERYGTAP